MSDFSYAFFPILDVWSSTISFQNPIGSLTAFVVTQYNALLAGPGHMMVATPCHILVTRRHSHSVPDLDPDNAASLTCLLDSRKM